MNLVRLADLLKYDNDAIQSSPIFKFNWFQEPVSYNKPQKRHWIHDSMHEINHCSLENLINVTWRPRLTCVLVMVFTINCDSVVQEYWYAVTECVCQQLTLHQIN